MGVAGVRVPALYRAVSTVRKGDPAVSYARNVLLVTAALCGIAFACATGAAACGSLDGLGGLAPGFGNNCVSR